MMMGVKGEEEKRGLGETHLPHHKNSRVKTIITEGSALFFFLSTQLIQ